MNLKELRNFMLVPGYMPVYLFNREMAKKAMEKLRNEPISYVDDNGVGGTFVAILPTAHWSEFQAHQHLETWDKRVSEDFEHYCRHRLITGDFSPGDGDGAFDGWRVE